MQGVFNEAGLVNMNQLLYKKAAKAVSGIKVLLATHLQASAMDTPMHLIHDLCISGKLKKETMPVRPAQSST